MNVRTNDRALTSSPRDLARTAAPRHLHPPVQAVILAAGMRAKSALADSFATECDVPEWAEIGDCVRARQVKQATYEGFCAAMDIL